MSESALSDIETLIDRLSIEDDWKCFVWYSISEIDQTRTLSQHWLRVFKNGWQNFVWYPDSQRWYTKQMKERFVWYQDKIKSETRISSGSDSSNIRPPVEIYKTRVQWECFNWYQDRKKFLERAATHFSCRSRCFEILVETRHLWRERFDIIPQIVSSTQVLEKVILRSSKNAMTINISFLCFSSMCC